MWVAVTLRKTVSVAGFQAGLNRETGLEGQRIVQGRCAGRRNHKR